MTSRVQKGGAVFKPAVKSRARTAAPSGDTTAKNAEPKITESLAPTLAVHVAPSTPLPATAQTQPPALSEATEPAINTPAPTKIYPSAPGPPSLAVSTLPISNPRPPAPTGAAPATSFSSSNRPVPPSIATNPPSIASTSNIRNNTTLSRPSSAVPLTSSRIPQTLASSHPPSHPPNDAFAIPSTSTGLAEALDFAALGRDLARHALPPSLPSLSLEPHSLMTFVSPELGAIDPRLQAVLEEQQVLHGSVLENTTPAPPVPEAAAEPKRKARSKKVVAGTDSVDEDEQDDGDDSFKPAKKSRKRSKSGGTSKPTRKRKASQPVDADADSDAETPAPAKKRRRTSGSTTSRSRKKRTPSVPPFDPDADPGEEIDPTVVTMAFLCEDPGFGRVSSKALEIQSNHAAWKARNKEKRATLRAQMERKKYALNESDDEAKPPPNKQQTPEPEVEGVLQPSGEGEASGSNNVVDESGNGFDYSQNLTTSRFNVQVRIGPNGETIIDETSLTVDRDENDATMDYTHVVESDLSKFTNSGTYGKRFRGSRWSAEETELFYDALSQYGENYELIAFVLPGRDRKSCKNKFKAEDKKNPARINFVLNNSKPVDMSTLSRMTGKDFSGPVPEIVAPPLHVLPPVQSQDSADVPPVEPPAPTRKRSQSRKLAMNDDVQILGKIDDFKDTDES